MADIGFEGLERFLHMVEGRLGRWGKPIGTTVLIIALVAFMLFCINHIINDGIVPFWNVIKTIKTNPKSSLAVFYEFVAQGGAILFWFVIVPIASAFLVGTLIGAYKYRNTVAGLKNRVELARTVVDTFHEFGLGLHDAAASIKNHPKASPQQVAIIMQKLLATFNKVIPKLQAYEKELKALDHTSSNATPSNSSAAKQAKKNDA